VEQKIAESRQKFEQLNESYKSLTNVEEKSSIDALIYTHVQKQIRMLKMGVQRKEMKERLERKEKKKRRRLEGLDQWGRRLTMAKDILEKGGYAELDEIQIEYDREERERWMRMRTMRGVNEPNEIGQHQRGSHQIDTSKMVRVKWTLLNEKAPKDIPAHVLRDLLQKKFGLVERVVVREGAVEGSEGGRRRQSQHKQQTAIVHFAYKASVTAVLQWKPTQMIHPHYIFEFGRVVGR